MELIFRKAVLDDATAIESLIILAWQKAYRGILSDALLDNRSTDEGSVRIRKGIETKPEFHYHVLETNGKIVGVSIFCPCHDTDLTDTTEIMVFYIHPDDQRQGLGRILMRETLAAIQESGCARVALWVFKDNHNARAFYEAMGFRTDGAEKALPQLENAATVRYRYAG
jgi:ribosomal protein S18 acetylase RimI-like enzyme